jgi:hypothetical protein
MAIIVAICPHCRATSMTFRIFGVAPDTAERAKANNGTCGASFAASCEACGNPVAGRAISTRPKDSFPDFPKRASNLVSGHGQLTDYEFVIHGLWPHPEGPMIPEHLPDAVEKAFKQAEKNFTIEGCEDAAALMYRSALEIALKDRFPTLKGKLAARIDQAVEQRELPPVIAEWAHEVRLVGNDSAHEPGGTKREDVTAARGFVDAVLRYLYSLPRMVSDRRFDRVMSKVLG